MKLDYFEIWVACRQNMMAVMTENLAADLVAGYDYFGQSATKQRAEIEAYRAEFDAQMKKLAEMDPKKVQHWCRVDMIRRGDMDAA